MKRTLVMLLIAILISGCSAFGPDEEPTATPAPAEPDPAVIEAAVAGTVEAALTEIAESQPTSTPEPSSTPEPTGTATETALPTVALDAELLEYHAEFIDDVTVPDGTIVLAGETFTKVWRIANVGTETWTTEFAFVFVNGERMEGNPINLPVEVFPGSTIDISIEMVAPLLEDVYTGFWMLSTPEGGLFGFGPGASGAVNVTIDVFAPTPEPEPTSTPTPTPTTDGAG